MEPLRPSAYAPYRDPRDYILSWTDTIWIDRAIGRLAEHYSEDIKVHTAYGEPYDYDSVISNSVQKFAAFPAGGGGHGEDVVWEQRGPNAFISSHRVLKTGTHSGFWTYGPPTGRDFISRTVAHCLVQDNRIVEEWTNSLSWRPSASTLTGSLPSLPRAARCWALRSPQHRREALSQAGSPTR
jgi:hypothetical protein